LPSVFGVGKGLNKLKTQLTGIRAGGCRNGSGGRNRARGEKKPNNRKKQKKLRKQKEPGGGFTVPRDLRVENRGGGFCLTVGQTFLAKKRKGKSGVFQKRGKKRAHWVKRAKKGLSLSAKQPLASGKDHRRRKSRRLHAKSPWEVEPKHSEKGEMLHHTGNWGVKRALAGQSQHPPPPPHTQNHKTKQSEVRTNQT